MGSNANDLQIKLLVDVIAGHLGKIGEMADQLKKVNSTVSAIDRAQQRAGVSATRAEQAQGKLAAAYAKHGEVMRTALIGMGIAATYAGARVAKAAVTDFASLEREITRIGITADATDDQIKSVSGTIAKIADDVALPLQDVYDGFDALVSAGRSWDESLKFLPAVVATAQAAGAATEDIAHTADALAGSMHIAGNEMQLAFDKLAKGGKMGKFELKDMASYLPSILPQMAALGYSGQAGLEKTIALLQTMRLQTGTAGEAATHLTAVLGKIYAPETVTAFKKQFHVNLTAELEKAKKNGEDLLDAFVRISERVTGGDMKKLAKAFAREELRAGVMSLIQMNDQLKEFQNGVKDAAGTIDVDLRRVLANTQADIDRLDNSWEGFKTSLGGALVKLGVDNALDTTGKKLDSLAGYARDIADVGISKASENRARRDALDRLSNDSGSAAYIEAYRRASGGADPSPAVAGRYQSPITSFAEGYSQTETRLNAARDAGWRDALIAIDRAERSDRFEGYKQGGRVVGHGDGRVGVTTIRVGAGDMGVIDGGGGPLATTQFQRPDAATVIGDAMVGKNLPSAFSAEDVTEQFERLKAAIPAGELGAAASGFDQIFDQFRSAVDTMIVKVSQLQGAINHVSFSRFDGPNPRANLGPSLPDYGPYGPETR